MTAFVFLLIASSTVAQTQADSWSERPGPPVRMGAGGGVVATDANTVYALCGGGQPALCSLDVGSGLWSRLPDLEIAVNGGGSIAFRAGSPYLYVTTGNTAANKRGFYRFDTAARSWRALKDFPVDEGNGVTITATANRVYALAGASGFWEYLPSADPNALGTWNPLTGPGWASVAGTALACPDPAGDYVYALRGGGSAEFLRYSIAGANADQQPGNSWQPLADLPASAGGGSALAVSNASSLYLLSSGSYELYEYSIPGKAWTTRLAAGNDGTCPAPARYGAGLVRPPGGGDIVYVLFAGPSNLLGRYSISADRYLSALLPCPSELSSGSATIAIDGDFYSITGTSSELYRYRPASDTWTPLAPLPGSFGPGASLASDDAGLVYACQGNANPYRVWRYALSATNAANQAADTWDGRGYQPYQPPACAFVYDGMGGFINGFGAYFRRYNPELDLTTRDPNDPENPNMDVIKGNPWETMPPPTSKIEVGGGAVRVGDTMFIVKGGGSDELWSYSCAGRVWNSPLRRSPYPINSGGAVCYCPVGNALFVMTGTAPPEGRSRLLSYSIDDDSWDERAMVPGAPTDGAMIAYPGSGPYLYASPAGSSRVLWRYKIGLPLGNAPAELAQFRADGSTPVAAGGIVRGGEVMVRARISHPGRRPVRLAVEVTDGAFSGTPTAISGLVASGSQVTLQVSNLPLGAKRWQAWTINEVDMPGGAVAFGIGGADLIIAADALPSPASPDQFRTEDGRRVLPGGGTLGLGIRITSPVSDPDGDTLRLRVEIRPAGEAFTGVATAASAATASGGTASLDIPLEVGEYHWQSEVVDEWGGSSGWRAHGSGPIDFHVFQDGSRSDGSVCSARGRSGAGSWWLLAFLLVIPFSGLRFPASTYRRAP